MVLTGEALERDVGNSIGATVSRQPGIHSADYGTAVGRPVIQGLSGARVRVMEDRIDAMDASVTSADHAVTVEPFLANRVEILKGPSTLLYGVGSIGGVVDVHTGRIPHEPTDFTGKLEVRAADNGDRTNAAVRLDGGGSSGLAWHLDAFSRSSNDYDIPGFAESARLRAAEEAEEEHHDEDEHEGEEEHDEHEDEHEEAFGRLPGSRADGEGGAFGLSLVFPRGFVGASVSILRYDYALPGEHAHAHEHDEEEEHEEHEEHEGEDEHDDHDEHEGEHEEEEGNVTLNLDQTKFDFEAGLKDPFGPFASFNLRAGVNDYTHVEIEPNAEVGTTFANESYELRAELVEDDGQGMDGVLGLQMGNRQFSAIGEEAFVPPVDTASTGLFWVGEHSFDNFDWELGGRIGRTNHEAQTGADADFTVFSASTGLVVPLDETVFSVHGSYSARAPIAEELFSDGPHFATASFEIGDPSLDTEGAFHGAATLSWAGDRASLTATAYATAFRDHIYQFATGEIEDGLPVFRYGQSDANFRGLDVQASVTVAEFEGGSLSVNGMFDTVAAEIDVTGNDRVPRLPPSRIGAGFEWNHGLLTVAGDYIRVFEQDETAAFELPTDAYDDLRLHVATRLNVGGGDMRLFFQGRNLTDDEQRSHTSYIKDMAPRPGRTLEVGVRLAF